MVDNCCVARHFLPATLIYSFCRLFLYSVIQQGVAMGVSDNDTDNKQPVTEVGKLEYRIGFFDTSISFLYLKIYYLVNSLLFSNNYSLYYPVNNLFSVEPSW